MNRLVVSLLVVFATPLCAEVVHLTDGTTLEGDLRRVGDGWLITTADGKNTLVTASQVQSIEFKKSGGGPNTADVGLASLRRAVANLSDVSRIIDRYRSFIDHNSGSPAAKEAEQDLALWQDRLDKGLVKAGDRWVTQQELVEMQANAVNAANQLRPLIASGKLNEALASIDRTLTIMPQNASLLYLKGVIHLRQLQLVPARTAFLSAEGLLPDHAATHNNLGVILWKQRSPMQALVEYDKAMLADPQNKTVLDNVTEALHGLPPEHQKNDLTKRVVAHYQDQEAALEKAMAAQGQYRWGSQWLDEKEFAKIQAEEKAVKEKVDSLKKDYDGVQADLLRIVRTIQDDKQIQQAIASSTVQFDPISGRAYQLPLPQRYYDLDRDIKSLQTEQVIKQRQLTDLQTLMNQEEKDLPTPKYLGIQRPFDVESMPGATSATTNVAVNAPAPPAPLPPTTAPSARQAVPPSTQPSNGGVDFSVPLPTASGAEK